MAPKWPEEVDVFSVPHSRMKELVQGYLDQMTATNFSSAIHLTTLLENLCNAFQEFKVHEQIENKYILCRLRQKLRSLSIRNSAVCNCHSDNRLTEMLELVKDGFQWMWRPQAERAHYGFKLRRALEDFTGTFIPHMEEEEAIFQPMLIEYFTYDELKAIKAEVIKQHLKKASENYIEEKFVEDARSSEDSSSDNDENGGNKNINVLPDEVLLKIFTYLKPVDITRCGQVSARWNRLSLDGLLWTKLYPVLWSKGIWRSMKEEEESDRELKHYDSYIVIDEDADIDETPGSELSSGGDDNVKQVKREVRILLSLVKYLLPKVGHSVKKCCLAYSRGISNGVVKKILKLCPNLEHLNLKHTRVTDAAFKVLGEFDCGRKLKHIDLSGCMNITDKTLEKVVQAFKYRESMDHINHQDQHVDTSVNFKTNDICDIEDTEKSTKMANSSRACSNSKIVTGNECDNKKVDNSPKNICSQCGKVEIGDSTKICNIDSTVSVLQDCLFKNYNQTTSGLGDLQIEFDQLVSLVKGDDSFQTDTSLPLLTSKPEPVETVKIKLEPVQTGLEYLNLSGCQNITTEGIQYFMELNSLPMLRYLDLSGCLNIGGEAIFELVNICPNLDHSQLSYCDNLDVDPFPDTASGCRNVECSARYCCRN